MSGLDDFGTLFRRVREPCRISHAASRDCGPGLASDLILSSSTDWTTERGATSDRSSGRGNELSRLAAVGRARFGAFIVSDFLSKNLAVAGVDLYISYLAALAGDLDVPDYVAVLVAEFGVLDGTRDRAQRSLLGRCLV